MTTELGELLSQAQTGNREACERIIRENSGLIWSVARRFFGRGVEPDDLFQLGCLGFLKAVAGFDGAYGTRFSTYAVPKIAGEIRRFLRDDGAVKVSRGLKERAALIRNTRARLCQVLGYEPSLSEISKASGLSVEDIAVAENATAPAQSLQYESGEEGFTLEAVLGNEGIEDSLLERLSLHQAVELLPDREKLTIQLRYFHHMTQQQTAKILGVSQVQISRLEHRALDRLRELL